MNTKHRVLNLLLAVMFTVVWCGLAQAADTTDITVGGKTKLSAQGMGKYTVLEKLVKFADNDTTATDILQIFNVPKDVIVVGVAAEVITAEGATLTLDIGDGTDPDGWLDGYNANAAAGTVTSSFVKTLMYDGDTTGAAVTVVISPAYSLGKHYTAADTIDATVNNASADVAIILFKLIAIQL